MRTPGAHMRPPLRICANYWTVKLKIQTLSPNDIEKKDCPCTYRAPMELKIKAQVAILTIAQVLITSSKLLCSIRKFLGKKLSKIKKKTFFGKNIYF